MRTMPIFILLVTLLLAPFLFSAEVEACVRLCGELNKIRQNEADAFTQWQEQRLLLEGEAVLARKRLAEAVEQLRASQTAFTASNARLQALREEADAFRKSLRATLTVMRSFEASLLSRQGALPDPLNRRFAPLFARFSQSEVPLEEIPSRLSELLSAYTEISAFASGVTVASVMIPEENGFSREYQVLYLGLASAYALSPDGHSAAVGQPGEAGWQWHFEPAWAKHIAKAIAIAEGHRPAELASLPMRISVEAAK